MSDVVFGASMVSSEGIERNAFQSVRKDLPVDVSLRRLGPHRAVAAENDERRGTSELTRKERYDQKNVQCQKII